jgi:hypothetical protein
MGAMKTLLRPVAQASAITTERSWQIFRRTHRHTQKVQERLLHKLLARGRQTDFGRDHGLGGVQDYDDFIKAAPVSDYAAHQPYIDRVLNGHTDALFPPDDPVQMFSMTSGTTGVP